MAELDSRLPDKHSASEHHASDDECASEEETPEAFGVCSPFEHIEQAADGAWDFCRPVKLDDDIARAIDRIAKEGN